MHVSFTGEGDWHEAQLQPPGGAHTSGRTIEPLRVVAEEIGFGVVGGVVAGALGAWVLGRFSARGWIRREGWW